MSTPVADKVHPAQEAVLQVARDYADAWRTADAPLMARAIHPEFTKRWLSRSPAGTYLEEAGASRMVRWTADGGGKATHERDEVLFLHQHGSIAATKVMMSDRVEHLLLAEFDSQWKLFTVFSESRQWEERRDKSVAARHEAAINRVVMDYTEGYYTGNPARARAAIHPDLCKKNVMRDPSGHDLVEYFTGSKCVATIARRGATGKAEDPWPEARATILDRYGDAALVKLETRWFDYQEVVLIDGEWKIINVLWTGKSGEPQAVEEWFYLRDSSEPEL